MKIEVSIGEVVDKLSILSIKLEKFKDKSKKQNVSNEFDILCPEMEKAGVAVGSKEFSDLKSVNLELWEIEDSIRVKESKGEFDDEFIQLARSVYFRNDVRAKIKKEINLKHGSLLIEEKEYVEYE